jgi:hypothetical protein
MNNKCGKNTAASVRDRLLALARERGEDFQLLLTQYGLERLLYRLSQSSYRDRFILKGAMLFLLWGDQPHRPTRDVDFLGFGDSSEAGLQAIFRELCGIPVEDDGLTLIAESVQVETIRDETEYGDIRVRLFGDLAGALPNFFQRWHLVVRIHSMPEIPVALQIQPEFRACIECFTQRQRGIRTDLTTAFNHLIEACVGPAEVCGKGLLGQTKWF